MNIEIPDSHLFRTALVLHEACAERLAEMGTQLAPPLCAEELAAAKQLAAGAWGLIEGLFEAQGMHLSLQLNMDMTIEHLNNLADV
ncbi:hypothetical protein GLA29479_3738 [Lysobacter antibioticus]|uniref:hypothetical protein n=1 Tax=Lysobacter antibioticus TaxID=84531 RepID=UPI0007175259|nr:hypothetical protein [Lysobacter antibioticus]ALN64589.1 hypothetical protein GLA29479_3738 [Lysobacter antibioticus]